MAMAARLANGLTSSNSSSVKVLPPRRSRLSTPITLFMTWSGSTIEACGSTGVSGTWLARGSSCAALHSRASSWVTAQPQSPCSMPIGLSISSWAYSSRAHTVTMRRVSHSTLLMASVSYSTSRRSFSVIDSNTTCSSRVERIDSLTRTRSCCDWSWRSRRSSCTSSAAYCWAFSMAIAAWLAKISTPRMDSMVGRRRSSGS